MSGEPRDVRLNQPQCWFLPVTRVYPTVMPTQSPHHYGLRHNVYWGLTCTGRRTERRTRPRWFTRGYSRVSSAYALWRVLTTFPSSASFGHPLSSARCSCEGDTSHQQRTDRDPLSNNAPRRAPPFRRSGCLSPSRHTKEKCVSRRDCSLRPSYRLFRSRRSHFVPKLGTVFLKSIASVTVRSPAPSVTVRKCKRLFGLFGTSAPGPDDPSTPTSSTDSAVDENKLSRSH